MKKVFFQVMFLFMLGVGALFAAEPDARVLLDKALEQKENSTFTAEFVAVYGSVSGKQDTYQLKSADGTVLRIIKTDSDSNRYTLVNRYGEYTVFPEKKTAVRRDGVQKELSPDTFNRFASYSIKSGQYGSVPCYIVTRKIAVTPEVKSLFLSSIPSDVEIADAAKEQIFAKNFPVVEVYTIGKDDNFIYRREYYNTYGDLISEIYCNEVNFSPDLAEEDFALPPDYTMEEPKSASELITATHELGTSHSANNSYNSVTWQITPALGKKLLVTALLVLIALLVGLKLFRSYRNRKAE